MTFDALPAHLLYNTSTQISLHVSDELAFMQTAQMIVTVDKQVAAQTVPLAIACHFRRGRDEPGTILTITR